MEVCSSAFRCLNLRNVLLKPINTVQLPSLHTNTRFLSLSNTPGCQRYCTLRERNNQNIKASFTPTLHCVFRQSELRVFKRYLSPSCTVRAFEKSFGKTVDEQTKSISEDANFNIRCHIENVFLSWMRNAYIMTLASITITNFAVSPTPAIISTVALILAAMNITVGSCGYLYGVSYLRRSGHMSRSISWLCQLGTLAHFIAWYIAASILLPELKMINDELNEIEEEEMRLEEQLKSSKKE